MSHSARWFLGVILAGCGPISASAQQSPGTPSPARSYVERDTGALRSGVREALFLPDQGREQEPWKSFSEVTRGAQIHTGVFTAYQKRDHLYLSLTPAQLDRDYLLVTQLSRGIGEVGLDGGTSIRSDLIRFHRAGDRIEMWVVNARFAATPGTPMAQAVTSSFGHSVAQSFPIATIRDDDEILFNIAPFLTSDWADLGAVFQGLAARRKV
ncbi:MAG: DUF5118 domain-containing protein, partial [bacterium]